MSDLINCVVCKLPIEGAMIGVGDGTGKRFGQTQAQPYPSDHLYPLFKHMSDNHGLTLLESELQEIVWAVERCKK